MISSSGAIAFATNCDRVPLRQLVSFVISSFLLQRGPPQYRVNNALRKCEFNKLAGIGKHIKRELTNDAAAFSGSSQLV